MCCICTASPLYSARHTYNTSRLSSHWSRCRICKCYVASIYRKCIEYCTINLGFISSYLPHRISTSTAKQANKPQINTYRIHWRSDSIHLLIITVILLFVCIDFGTILFRQCANYFSHRVLLKLV